VRSVGNPGPRGRPYPQERAEKLACCERFSIFKNESRILWSLLAFGEGRWGALRLDGWGRHPVIDMEVGTVLIG
jgi:hypothetical protein